MLNLKKTLSIGLISTISIITLASCATPQKDIKEVNEENAIIVTHSKGETTVSKNPEKAVVFDMGILDSIDALGIDVELAVPVASLPTSLADYESVATNAGGIKEPDMEAIYEFQPDVIFISGRQEDYYDELSEIAPTIYVDLEATTYMEDFERNITYLGEIFSKEQEAKSAIDEINTIVENTKLKTADLQDKALILLANNGSLSVYGSGSRFGLIHDVLGIKSADETIEVSTHGQEASYEYISKINPDIIYVIDRTTVVGGEQQAGDTLENDLVKSTNAYKNNKIIYLDAESWYLVNGGINSVKTMVSEIENSLS